MKKNFKSFDKVIVRNDEEEYWSVDFFSHKNGDWFVCVGGMWNECLPYCDETKDLVGTDKTYKPRTK